MIVKARVYYQDFILNKDAHFGNDDALIFKPADATFMKEFEIPVDMFGETKRDMSGIRNDIAGKICEILNCNARVQAEIQPICKASGRHTSMSIGDYIVFEDGEAWLCKSLGWKIIPPKENI